MVRRAIVLFIHTIVGCIVTCRRLVMGKCFAVNQTNRDFHFCQQCRVCSQVEQAKQDIIVAGEKALVSLYGGAKVDALDVL